MTRKGILLYSAVWLFVVVPGVAAPLDERPAVDDGTPRDAASLPSPAHSGDPFGGIGLEGAAEPLPPGSLELEQAHRALVEGNLELCQDKLRQAYVKRPNLPPPNLMFARLLLDSGRESLGRQMLEHVAVSHPDHPELYLAFGRIALGDGRVTDAFVHFDRAVSLDRPKNWLPAQHTYLEQECLWGKTQVAERRGDWARAVEYYPKLAEGSEPTAELRDRWATALFRAGNREQAWEQFSLAYLQDSRINPPEVSMGVMFVGDADHRRAEQWFNKALEKYPDHPAVHAEWSFALLRQDRAAEAGQHADKAVVLGVNDPTFEAHRGLIAMQAGDFARAAVHFDDILQASPGDLGTQLKLALALAESNIESNRQRARKLAEAAAREHPDQPQVKITLGWVLFRSGNVEQAEESLRAAVAQLPTDRTALFFLGQVLMAQDDEEKQPLALRVAEQLRRELDRPGTFVLRPAARRWLSTTLSHQAD